MKYLPYIVVLAICIGCKNRISNTENEVSSICDSISACQQEEQIKINVLFQPTFNLTDDIKRTSLEELIRQDRGNFSPYEQKTNQKIYKELYNRSDDELRAILVKLSPKKATHMRLIRSLYGTKTSAAETWANETIEKNSEYKYVPASSNLAKIYYLQDMGEFIRNNEDYFQRIQDCLLEERKQKMQKEKKWDIYIK